ncbi:MAG: ATP-binding protein [Chloroflexi bacterium]|nr:ATP-binding protein [Chloroflexota bacterium]
MRFRPSNHSHRPPWWPETEAWPPVKDRMRHNPFFRRLGCAFAVFNLLGFGVFFAAAAWIANLFGLTKPSASLLPWIIPLGIILLVFVAAVVLLGIFGVRRVFAPLDDLLAAAGRVADGDYSTRVTEKGPAEVRSLVKAFNNMAARLHRTDEQRRNLLADVTHELRTPLTIIQGNLEGMLDGIYPADDVNLQALLDETNILSRLVEDLRTLALAESGALKLRLEPADLSMLIRDTLTAFQSQAEAAGLTLSAEIGAEIPWLGVDPVRIRQVLSNLIANALRHTPAGGLVRVNYQLEDGRALLEVQDTGPGIPAEDLPHIFERFYKSTDSGGSGLGLAIARHLVNAHGGTISAESAPASGTTIRISLPLDT